MVLELVNDAPDLSTRLQVLNWFGTFPSRESRDRDSEMIDEATTSELVDDLRRRVAEASPEALLKERSVSRLLGGLLEPDQERGRELVRSKVQDDELMLALLRALYGEQQSQVFGEAAVRRVPTIGWKTLAELVGEDWLRERLLELDETSESRNLEAETAAALGIALAITRGERAPDPAAG
jgi:hypothetical protein